MKTVIDEKKKANSKKIEMLKKKYLKNILWVGKKIQS